MLARKKKLSDPVSYRDLQRVITRQDNTFFWCMIILFVLISLSILLSIAALFIRDHTESKSHHHETLEERHPWTFHMTENMKPTVQRGVFDLGTAYDQKSHKLVNGYSAFLYTQNPSEELEMKRNHGTGPCGDPFASGARWKVTEDFVVDGTNNQQIPEQFFFDMNWLAMCEWDSKLNFKLFGKRDTNAIADGSDEVSPDGKNELQFCFIGEPGVIAVTTVWGIFDGPVNERELIEADICYNLNFRWGNASTTGDTVMDGWNIAAHEIGHYVGFGHIPLTDATMFGNADFRETRKRNLLQCEIESLCNHYGESGGSCPGHNSTGSVPPRFTSGGVTARSMHSTPLIFVIFLVSNVVLSLL